MPQFGQRTGKTAPRKSTYLHDIDVANGKKPAVSKKRKVSTDARFSFVKNAQYDANDNIVGGGTFRAKGQHEGLPTALAEQYADGRADAVMLLPAKIFKSKGTFEQAKKDAYGAGFRTRGSYTPLTRADTLRSSTSKTVLVSPKTSSSGASLKVAGFHPSPISLSVPESVAGHDQLFKAQAEVLKAHQNGKLSDEATDLALAAVHLASLAPGKYAAQANFSPTAKSKFTALHALLPDDPQTYEERREELKLAIAKEAMTLSVAERLTISTIVDDFLASVAHSTLPKGVSPRMLGNVITKDRDAPVTSPLRQRPKAKTMTIQAGDYDMKNPLVSASTISKTIPEASAAFFDE